jgi:hypothetical protein
MAATRTDSREWLQLPHTNQKILFHLLYACARLH